MYSHKKKANEMIFGAYAHKKLPHNPAMNTITKEIFSNFLMSTDSRAGTKDRGGIDDRVGIEDITLD
jgi:hypothetical protein